SVMSSEGCGGAERVGVGPGTGFGGRWDLACGGHDAVEVALGVVEVLRGGSADGIGRELKPDVDGGAAYGAGFLGDVPALSRRSALSLPQRWRRRAGRLQRFTDDCLGGAGVAAQRVPEVVVAAD